MNKKDRKILEEEYRKILEEEYLQEQQEREKLEKAFDYYKNHCNISVDDMDKIDFDFSFEEGKYYHIGYCEIEECPEYKNNWYPSYSFYKIAKNDANKYNLEDLYFMKSNEKYNFHYLVWQKTGFLGDDYYGYLLLPLKNNKYWIIQYSI